MKKRKRLSIRMIGAVIIFCFLLEQIFSGALILPAYSYPVTPAMADKAPNYGQLTAIKYRQVEIGELGAMALDYAGNVWVWGYNLYGELGNGKQGNYIASDLMQTNDQAYAGGIQRVPRFRDEAIRIEKIARGERSCYALDSDGNLWTWGINLYGQLARDTSIFSTVLGNYGQGIGEYGAIPQKADLPSGMGKIIKMDAGSTGVMILDDSGSVWVCGYNGYGEHGQGNVTITKEYMRTFHKVDFGTLKISDISCGYNHRMTLDENGDMWSWGWNNNGQLGNNSVATLGFTSPAKIVKPSGMTGKITQISNGVWNSQALCEDGTVWEWGRVFGNEGQNTPTSNPVIVNQRIARKVPIDTTPGIPGISSIQGDYYGGYFVDTNGNIWSWGSNVHYIFGYNAYPGGGQVGTLNDPTYNMTDRTARWRPYTVGDGDQNQDGVSPYTVDVSGLHVQGGVHANDRLPFIVKMKSYDEIHAALDSEGNVWIWSYGGSGRIAYGYAGDPGMLPMHALGAEKTVNGLYDRYAYEPILLNGATPYNQPQTSVVSTKKKIYKDPGISSLIKDKLTIDVNVPEKVAFGYKENPEKIDTELKTVKYVRLDPDNPYFNSEPNAGEGSGESLFDKAYRLAAESRKGIVYDKSINKNDLDESITVNPFNGTEDTISGTALPGSTIEMVFPNVRQGPNSLYPLANTTVNGRLYYGNDKPANEPLPPAPGTSSYYIGTTITGVGTHINPKTITVSAAVDQEGNWTITIPKTTIKLSLTETAAQTPNVKIQTWDKISITEKDSSGKITHSVNLGLYQGKSIVRSSEINIDDNCKIWIMMNHMINQTEDKSVTVYTADNFYTRIKLKNEGRDAVSPHKIAYKAFDHYDSVYKEDYGIPIWDKKDKKEVIQNPTYGYDTVRISRYDEIKSPGFALAAFYQYWSWSDKNPNGSNQLNFKDYQLNVLDFLSPETNAILPNNTHVFYYTKNQGEWVNITYDGKMKDSEETLHDFALADNPESVMKHVEMTRTPPEIDKLTCIGYRINDGAFTGLENGVVNILPLHDTKVTYIYIDRLTNKKLHIRQIIIEPGKIEKPLAAFMKLDNINEEGTKVKSISNIVTEAGDVLDDVPYSVISLPKLDGEYMFYRVSLIVPEYYSYLGFTLSYEDKEHNTDKINAGTAKIDYSVNAEAWVNLYITPSTDTPSKYNWEYAVNQFGQIKK